MALTLSTADSALKEDYQPAIREQLNNSVMFLQQIERNTKDVVGRRAVLSLHVRRNSGVGARGEGGALPAAGSQRYAEERVSLRYNYGHIEITGPTIRAMRSDEGAFIRALDSETEGVTNDLRRDVNRQLFGTSDGVIVEVGAGSSTTSIVFATTATAVQKRQIEVGMLIDVGTSSPFTSVGTQREVTAVSSSAITVTPAFAGAPASGDKVVRSGSGGSSTLQKELTGLQTIVAASGSLFNVDPSTEPAWAAYHDDAAADRLFTEQLAAKTIHNVSINGGVDFNLIMTSDGVTRSFSAQLSAMKRSVNTLDLKGGYKALAVTAGGNEVPLTWDRDAPSKTALCLTTSHLFQHEASDWEWMDEDGAVLSRVSGRDAYEAILFKYHELTTDKRNAHGLVTDLIEA